MKITDKSLEKLRRMCRDLPSGRMEYVIERMNRDNVQHLLHVPDPTPGEQDLIVEIEVNAWLSLCEADGDCVVDDHTAEAIGKWIAEMWIAAPALVAEIKRLRDLLGDEEAA